MSEFAVIDYTLPETLPRHILIAEKTVGDNSLNEIGVELKAVAIVEIDSLHPALFKQAVGKSCAINLYKGKIAVFKAAVSKNRSGKIAFAETAEPEKAVAESSVIQICGEKCFFIEDFVFKIC